VTFSTNTRLYASVLAPGDKVEHVNRPGRHTWIQVAKGRVKAEGVELGEGDGASTSTAGPIAIEGTEAAEVLVFDLA
jgi:redox-sensitive bicupin YhaK (pirin superfamily)